MPLSPGGHAATWLAGLLVALAWVAWRSNAPVGRARLARLGADGAAERHGRCRPVQRRKRVDGPAVAATVATALDLLAACLYSGAPLEQALQSVAAAFDGEVAGVLAGVAHQAALGAPVETAWAAALADPEWSVAARAVVRAHYSGASLTDVLSRTADERRRAARAATEASAGRAAVRAVLPLGVCFLPAFVLAGIVPVVAGFAASLWA